MLVIGKFLVIRGISALECSLCLAATEIKFHENYSVLRQIIARIRSHRIVSM